MTWNMSEGRKLETRTCISLSIVNPVLKTHLAEDIIERNSWRKEVRTTSIRLPEHR